MDVSQIPSLKQLTIVKVICAFVNTKPIHENLLPLSNDPDYYIQDKSRQPRIENSILEKMSLLVLPEVLKEELARLVRPFLIQIEALLHFNQEYCDLQEVPTTILWTAQGTIDKKKTAELLVQDENVSVYMRFTIACVYCLENQIRSLWTQLSEEQREDLIDNIEPGADDLRTLFVMCFEEDELDYDFVLLIKDWGISVASMSGNETAFNYFVEKFTSEEKADDVIFLDVVPFDLVYGMIYGSKSVKLYCAELLCILLSVLNEKEQVQLFTRNEVVAQVLKCFFLWPGRNLGKILKGFWTFLQPSSYQYLFRKLKKRISKGRKDRDYQMMFRMFWERIPDDQKENVIDHCISETSLIELFEVLEEVNVRLILNDVVATIGMKIDFQCNRWTIYQSLIRYNKWDSFKFYLEECAKVTLMSLKDEVESVISMEITQKNPRNMLLNKSFEVIDKCIRECGDNRKK